MEDGENMNPKIIHLTNRLSGGVMTAIEHIVQSTPEFCHSLVYVGGSEQEISKISHLNFNNVEFIPRGRLGATIKNLKAILARLEVDIVHAHSSWAGLYSRLNRINSRVVYQPHGFAFANPKYPFPLRFLFWAIEKYLAKNCSLILAVGRFEASLAKRLVGPQKTLTLRNESMIEPRPWKSSRALGSVRIGTIGRVCHEKDPKLFLSVVENLRESHFSWEFVWIGDGDTKSKKALHEAGVHVTGWLQGDELLKEISALDVYVSTSKSEGMPFALLDALALGIPPVLRDIPAYSEENLPTFRGQMAISRAILDVLDSGLGKENTNKLDDFRLNEKTSSFGDHYRTAIDLATKGNSEK
jgi:glycosyltransferase involved in cell wall biosynthesis